MAFHPGRHPLASFWPLSCICKAKLSPGHLDLACEPLAPERTRTGRCGAVFWGALPFASSREVLEGPLPSLGRRRRSQLLHSHELERHSLARESLADGQVDPVPGLWQSPPALSAVWCAAPGWNLICDR